MVTLEEYAALPKHPRYELVAGVLLGLPMPEYADHEESAALACYQLGRHVFPKRLGVVLGSNYGYVTIKEPPSTCRNADVSFISEPRLKIKPDLFGMLYDGAPDLAVEIISRHPVDFEIPRKITEYLNSSGKAVWVIDIDARTLTVHIANAPPLVLADADTVDGADYLPGFACAVADLLPARAG